MSEDTELLMILSIRPQTLENRTKLSAKPKVLATVFKKYLEVEIYFLLLLGFFLMGHKIQLD